MTQSTRILVIEDHDMLRDATVGMLKSNGYQAFGASCAEDLVELSGRWPDIFIIDVNLPGENGFSLAARLRGVRPRAGIVIATARTQAPDRIDSYKCGADLYLAKPIDPDELLAALHALRRRLGTTEHAIEFTLDQQQHILKGPTAQAMLSDSESRLLVSFALAQNQILEHWQVSQALTPGAQDVNLASLQVRMSHLRKKIQSCGGDEHAIHSLRRTGYQLTIRIRLN